MRILLFILLFSQIDIASLCTLCHFRTPPRPRPLDQYKLPKKAPISFERMPKFCNASRNLPVDDECKQGFTNIFCSSDALIDAFGGCESLPDDGTRCSKCAYQKADNMWVFKWFDSLGKPPAGISDGNYYWLGDYEICSELRSQSLFDGQYCRVEIEVPDEGVESGCPQTDPLSIILGVCFPSSCSAAQLTSISELYLPYNVKVECESDSGWSTVTYLLLLVAFLWLIPQFVATLQNGHIDSILACFSITENTKRAFSIRRSSPNLHCVHGLEFIVNFCLICGLVYNFMLPFIENVAFAFDGVKSPWMHAVNNYSFQVDALLALSSFYTTYLLFGSIKSIRECFDYIVMRLFRFWPAYITCVLFMYIIFPGISSGPMWIHSEMVERCESGWWKNILFINNWFNVTDTCVDFGYVISLEAQYYVMLIFVLYMSTSYPFITQMVAYLAIVVSTSISFYRAYAQALPPAPMLTVEPVSMDKTHKLFDQMMLSIITRISPYCIGFIFGIGCARPDEYLRTQGLKYTPHKILAILCILCAIYPFAGAFGYSARAENSPIWSAAYAALHRPLWAFSILSFVYLCHNGAFGWLNHILGWRVFAPLAKQTWIAAVVAEPVILYFFSSLNKPAHATHWSTLYAAISATSLSYMIALAIDIFVSRPIRYLIYREQKHRYAQAHVTDDTTAN